MKTMWEEAAAEILRLRKELASAGELLAECETMFRWYGDLHAAKPDMEKAKRNYDMADKIRALKTPPTEQAAPASHPPQE